ncbi:uncharacterized protein LOC143240041 isoform X2 [Tachypleus tridentatus]|uniref:uncharacterized protein LOC143240041 isoform X2 n=1 Tax=Tachypleus tridentatus TaxID=6853 RepID=UPI003FD43117
MDLNTSQDSFCNRLQNVNTAFLKSREGVIQIAQIGVIHHVTALIFYQSSTIALFLTEGQSYQRAQVLVAGVFGQLSSFLYFISSFISFRSLRN